MSTAYSASADREDFYGFYLAIRDSSTNLVRRHQSGKQSQVSSGKDDARRVGSIPPQNSEMLDVSLAGDYHLKKR
jgi:hypothetical protein